MDSLSGIFFFNALFPHIDSSLSSSFDSFDSTDFSFFT